MRPDEIHLAELTLRPWRQDDAPEVFEALTDPDIRRWSPADYPATLSDVERWIVRRADASDDSVARWAVTDRGKGTLLGSVGLHRINLASQDASIGYWTVAQARGRGVATASVNAATRWAFDTLPLHRIELCHAVANEASCRVAAKTCYAYEGTLRDAMRYSDGQWRDEHLHARLSSDQHP